MLRDLRGWPTPAPILAAAAALDFGVVTYMIVRRLHPPPPGSRAPPQVTRRMAAAVLGDGRVIEAQHDRHGPEGPVESSSRLVRCLLIIYVWPAHVNMLLGQAGHGIGEFHGGCAVQLEQPAPAERGEDIGGIGNRRMGLGPHGDPGNGSRE